ncbi:MAP kinase kinase Wis1 [Tilletia horrida]|nr:MAP kinase kinase Wis1 [Tilletia horrida]
MADPSSSAAAGSIATDLSQLALSPPPASTSTVTPPASAATTASAPTARPSPIRPAAMASASAVTSPTPGPGGAAAGGGPTPSLNRQSLQNTTRQLANTPLPPSLRAKMLASAQRAASASPASSSAASSPSPGPGAVLGPDQRLDTARLLGTGPGGIGSSGSSGPGGVSTPRGFGAAPGAGFPSRLPPGFAPQSPATGLGGAALGATSGPGAAAARRPRPALRLVDVYGPNSTGGPEGSANSAAAGAPIGLAPGRAAPSGAASGGMGRRLGPPGKINAAPQNTPFANFSKIVDSSGRLNFNGKAVLHASGVQFENGTSFKINMEDLELQDELGKGNYGTVRRVKHRVTNVQMAMKEIRLELDDSKLNAIIMELDILHRATVPQIVEFYGAFFIESCVYYCMEYMDARSIDKLYNGRGSIPEDVLARITSSMVKGLRFLKDELQIMHRDVKPTNVLCNRRGQVKLCDFGVSGQLEKSLAKTNIGCQSYMAPERIQGESQFNLGTYTVASDVWSLGLSMVEMTLGTYPYPPETYANVFAQLQAIVHGDPPQIPPELYSEQAQDFVAACLDKVPARRATYADMLSHPFLVADEERGEAGVDMRGWVEGALKNREEKKAGQGASPDTPIPAPATPASASIALGKLAITGDAPSQSAPGPSVVVEPPTPVNGAPGTGVELPLGETAGNLPSSPPLAAEPQ